MGVRGQRQHCGRAHADLHNLVAPGGEISLASSGAIGVEGEVWEH